MRHLPNLLSILRLVLILPFVLALDAGRIELALACFTLAGITDGLDGWLAARFGWRSWLGGVLDPIADKALLVAGFVSLGMAQLAPWWLVFLVLARDVVIVSGALAYHLFIARFRAAPSLLSKANTLAQLGFVFLTLADAAFGLYGEPAATALLALVVLTTLSSGLHYVVVWSLRARRHKKENAA